MNKEELIAEISKKTKISKKDASLVLSATIDTIQSQVKKGLDVKSVIVFGRIKIVEDFDKTINICRKLSNQFDFGEDYIEEEIKNFGRFVMCLELTPEHITGKIINES